MPNYGIMCGMKNRIIIATVLSIALTGCFTVSETPYPQVEMSKLPADKKLEVQISGFEASITAYMPVYGTQTIVTDCYGYRRHHQPRITTIATETYVPQVSNTPIYRDRATDALEKAGFILQTTKPKYKVEVKFSGPFDRDGDVWTDLACNVLSVFTLDYGAQVWSARLKIYDLATGEVVLFKDYTQEYELYVFGLIPIFSTASCDKLSYNAIQNWALTALTDRVIADATARLTDLATP